jgi:hypothetical protein
LGLPTGLFRRKKVYGANIDSFSVARSMGISADRAFDYVADSEGVHDVQLAMSVAVRNCRIYGSVDAGEDFRAKIKKPKKKN